VGTSGLAGLTSAQLAEIHFTGLPTGAKLVANGANGEVVPLSTTPLLIGDLNGDSHVNATDITTMLTALTDLNAYKTAHPTLDSASLTDIADLNSDGAFNNLDLQGLITYLKTGHGSLSAVPEPGTYVLLAAALPAMVTVARRRVAKKSKFDEIQANSGIAVPWPFVMRCPALALAHPARFFAASARQSPRRAEFP
jgi:hypothetical protein